MRDRVVALARFEEGEPAVGGREDFLFAQFVRLAFAARVLVGVHGAWVGDDALAED